MHSPLSSIAGSPSSPGFPNCSSPRKSASVYADYLGSHFSVSQSKSLCSRARGYLYELRRATCPEESHSSFCCPFSPAEFHAAASKLSSSTFIEPDKVAYPMLKHLPRSGLDFLLHIFNLSWSSHSFSSIWKISFIIPIHKMGKPLDSPASFWPISLTFCLSKLFERIILSRLAPLTLWRLSVSLRPLVHTLGSCLASGAPWSSAMPPSLGRGLATNNNTGLRPPGKCGGILLSVQYTTFLTSIYCKSFLCYVGLE